MGNASVSGSPSTPPRRITFTQVTDPFLAEIVNEVGIDRDGRTTFTLYVTLAAAGLRRAADDLGYGAETDAFFGATMSSIVAAMHRRIDRPHPAV